MIEAPRTPPGRRPRIVLAHDWLCGVRGGEHVLERLCRLVESEYEPAGLLTMFADGRPIGESVDRWIARGLLRVSWLNRVPGGPGSLRRWLFPLYPSAVGHLSRQLARMHAREPIDLVVSTSSAAIKGLRPPEGVPHLCYCFSPARYVWAGQEMYGRDRSLKGLLRNFGLRAMSDRFRAWDRRTASHVTRFVAISEHIRQRIRGAFGAESDLVFPPVRTGYFTPDDRIAREDFWLCVGALEPYKRVDLAIEAAVLAGVRIRIAGEGSQRGMLERKFLGRPGVEFLGRVSDESLRDLYRRARVLVFPQEEDFGIVAVEAQACGLPVVALARGGALDMVVDGSTGVLFQQETPEAIAEAVHRLPGSCASACRANAVRFAEDRFDREFQALISARLIERVRGPRPAEAQR